MTCPEQAFALGAVLTPPFKGERQYVAAVDILRAVEVALCTGLRRTGTLSVEFRQVVDSGLKIVAGLGADAPVRLRWSGEDTAQIFSLERVTGRAPRAANALPPYVLTSSDLGAAMTLTELGGHANLCECVVDAGKRLLPAPDALSQWLVRSVELNLCLLPQPRVPYTLSREVLRGGLMRGNVDDQAGCRVLSVVSVLVRPRQSVNGWSDR